MLDTDFTLECPPLSAPLSETVDEPDNVPDNSSIPPLF